MKVFIANLCFFSLVASVHAQNDTLAFSHLVEAERSFAKMSASNGMREAFLNFLADDGILFRPGPQVGKPLWQKAQTTTNILKWEPEVVDIARSGDFGFTTGPWELQSYRPLSKPLAYGYFVSIWKKQRDGAWKVAVDLGTSCEFLSAADMSVRPAASPQPFDPGTASELIAADSLLSAQYVHEGSKVLIDKMAGTGRVHREHRLPIVDNAAIHDFLAQESLPPWTVLRGETAPSGDLGYTYGRFETSGEFYYLRIWRKEGHTWRILLDLTTLKPSVRQTK